MSEFIDRVPMEYRPLLHIAIIVWNCMAHLHDVNSRFRKEVEQIQHEARICLKKAMHTNPTVIVNWVNELIVAYRKHDPDSWMLPWDNNKVLRALEEMRC